METQTRWLNININTGLDRYKPYSLVVISVASDSSWTVGVIDIYIYIFICIDTGDV